MRSLISLVTLGVIINVNGATIPNIGNGNPYLLNNLPPNNLVSVGLPNTANRNNFANANYLPNNCADAILEPIANSVIANSIIPNEVITNLPKPIASASTLSNTVGNIEFTNIQFMPLSDLMSSLKLGDINVNGDLPIGGTIKVRGCIPVYGMITVDGVVPSAGKAIVSESFGNQIADGIPMCANQYFS